MPRRHQLPAFVALVALAGVLAAGCSGDDEKSGDDKASGTARTAPGDKAKPGRERGKADERPGAGKKKGRTARKRLSKAEIAKERRALKREAEQDRREDREFDRGFRETAFEKLVGQLPIREPPLFVEQYITSRGSSTVYTAVAPKRFFCGRSPARRKAAVTAFYRDAAKLFRRRGVNNFVQVVTPIAETAERLPALATGRNGSVSLTKRGRAKGPC
ncbi:MAG: hypothetical protein M3131_08940 [Actinomycetota bacterium]|nr:hypothetical protein [Actinomycetota bacterium]